MKQLLTIFMVFALGSFNACGGDSNPNENSKKSSGSKQSTQQAEKNIDYTSMAKETCEWHWNRIGELTGHADQIQKRLDQPLNENVSDTVREWCYRTAKSRIEANSKRVCSDLTPVLRAYRETDKAKESLGFAVASVKERIEKPEQFVGKSDGDFGSSLSNMDTEIFDAANAFKKADLDLERMKRGERVKSKNRTKWKACKEAKKKGRKPAKKGKKLQNGEIPGYKDCIARMMKFNPKAKSTACCTEVGGTIVKGGTFPVCEK